MRLETIEISNVRILSNIILYAEPGLNLIFGPNGSGKTSVLEAINLLSRARSFRTHKLGNVIQEGRNSMQVSARIVTDDNRHIVSGMDKQAKATTIRFNGEPVRRMSEQVRNVPVLVLTPESQGLLTDTPKTRRHWLDWLMFHVEPDYLPLWSEYQRTLRHRNQLLRARPSEEEFIPWETRMSEHAGNLACLCHNAVTELEDQFKKEIAALLSDNIGIVYSQGWSTGEDLAPVLERHRNTDRDAGYTRHGPHRADVRFLFQEHEAGGVLSRGQSKLYMVALLLAQAEIIHRTLGKRPIMLIDDVFAELDVSARERLAQRLSIMSVQTFITGTEESMKNYCSGVFHVEQGKILKQKLTEN